MKSIIITEYLQTFTDIVMRNHIRKVDQLERIVRFAFDNVERTFSASSISKYLKSENRTIDNAEIDFIATKQENKMYMYVLRADAFAGGNYQGIKTMHIADFLLSNEY